MLWQATPASLWQGRDDSAEAPNALRLFQTIARAERFAPQEMPGDIALLGFACDEGVRRNKGLLILLTSMLFGDIEEMWKDTEKRLKNSIKIWVFFWNS